MTGVVYDSRYSYLTFLPTDRVILFKVRGLLLPLGHNICGKPGKVGMSFWYKIQNF